MGEQGQEALCHTKVCDGRSCHSRNGGTQLYLEEAAGKFRIAGITGVGVCCFRQGVTSSLL